MLTCGRKSNYQTYLIMLYFYAIGIGLLQYLFIHTQKYNIIDTNNFLIDNFI